MTIEELFGTLQMSVVAGWRKHLRSAKYGKHEALDEFYKEMPEKVDALIEAWMGAYGKKVGAFQNVLSSSNLNTLKYLQELKKVCKQGYELLGDNDELKSLLDDIVNLINSTLYKVKELSESRMKNLKDFVLEALSNNEALNEAKKTNLEIGYVVDIIASLFPDMKWYKELKHNDVIDVLEYYALVDELIYNLGVTEDEFYDWIEDNDSALAKELKDI